MMKKIIATLGLLILSTAAFAVSYQCPGTTAFVDTGQTIEQVVAACGAPTTRYNTEVEQKTETSSFEWIYTRVHPAATKMSVKIVDDVVSSVTVDGEAVTNTTFCGSAVAIRKGTPARSILNFCGRPGVISQLKTEGPKIKQIQLVYKTQAYMPAVVFIFTGGKLSEVRNLE